MVTSMPLSVNAHRQTIPFKLPQDAQTIIHEQFEREERIVATRQERIFVQVLEWSYGPLTQEVFESPWRLSTINVPNASLRNLFSGCSDGEILSNVALFFLSDRHLSEFMDFLDANDVPFRHKIELSILQGNASGEGP